MEEPVDLADEEDGELTAGDLRARLSGVEAIAGAGDTVDLAGEGDKEKLRWKLLLGTYATMSPRGEQSADNTDVSKKRKRKALYFSTDGLESCQSELKSKPRINNQEESGLPLVGIQKDVSSSQNAHHAESDGDSDIASGSTASQPASETSVMSTTLSTPATDPTSTFAVSQRTSAQQTSLPTETRSMAIPTDVRSLLAYRRKGNQLNVDEEDPPFLPTNGTALPAYGRKGRRLNVDKHFIPTDVAGLLALLDKGYQLNQDPKPFIKDDPQADINNEVQCTRSYANPNSTNVGNRAEACYTLSKSLRSKVSNKQNSSFNSTVDKDDPPTDIEDIGQD